MNTIMARLRDITVQGANDSNTLEERTKIATEASQLKAQMIQLSNTSYAGRYIFSGFKTDQKLLDDDQNSPNYGRSMLNVDTVNERIYYEVGISDSININVAGGDIFNHQGNISNDINGYAQMKTNFSFPMTIDATNNTIGISVDGHNINASITTGNYADSAGLAAEITNQINSQIAVVNAGLPATATPIANISVGIDNDKLTITSGSTGATSSIKVTTPQSNFFTTGTSSISEVAGDAGEVPTLVKCFDDVIAALYSDKGSNISAMLSTIDGQINNILRVRADVGARQNRLDLTADRQSDNEINFTNLMSVNEDADMAETIMNMKNEENVYKASLAGGARIIQPSLIDFLR